MNSNNPIVSANTLLPKHCIHCAAPVQNDAQPITIHEHVPIWLAPLYPVRAFRLPLLRIFLKKVNVGYFVCKRHKTAQLIFRILGFLGIVYGGVGLAIAADKSNILLMLGGPALMLAGIYLYFFHMKLRAIPSGDSKFQLRGHSDEFSKIINGL